MLWLADMVEQESRSGLLRSAFWMWAALAAAGTILVLTIGAAVAVRRSRRRGAARRRPAKAIPDAWQEAGRRAEPIRLDEPPPDVLPDDPSPERNT
jgi:hypothetical protein